jgi:CubicO group peptidase (beta-lactamase class C family)
MKRWGSLPLAHQPGEKWMYNSGSDILGILISRATGKTLATFLRERIFAPLAMKDTAFSVPGAKVDRLATAYQTDFATGKTVLFDEARGGRFARPPVFESGAGGLVSTVDDFLAFGRMMLAKGVHGRERILSRPSVELMTADHLTAEQKAVSDFFPDFWDNRGPDRDPDDSTGLGFAGRSRSQSRFLDHRLPGDRRLGKKRTGVSISPGPVRRTVRARLWIPEPGRPAPNPKDRRDFDAIHDDSQGHEGL